MQSLTSDAIFRTLLENLYFHQQWLVETIAYELLQYHHDGVSRDGRSSRFLNVLTERLLVNREAKDLPNALAVIVADIFADYASEEDGQLSAKRIEHDWGPNVASLLNYELWREASPCSRSRPRNPVTENELVRHVSVFAPRRMAALLDGQVVPPALPLIDQLVKEIGRVDASIGAFVCVQHLLGSTVPLVRAIASDQIDREGIFILGKPYSTNYATMWVLREQYGWFVHPGSARYSGLMDFHFEEDQDIESLLMKCVRWTTSRGCLGKKRVLLMDDGGRCIRRLHERDFSDVVHRFTCVEQTRRGIYELSGMNLITPVVNVAESWGKLKHESPMIAESVCQCLLQQLDLLRSGGIEVADNALIVGFGAIGSAVANALRNRNWEVAVFDSNREKCATAAQTTLRVESDLRTALSQASVVVGCTGRYVLEPAQYGWIRDGAVLVGASSADSEFTCRYLRAYAESFSALYRHVDEFNLVHERYGNRMLYLGDVDHPCHFLYVIRYQGKRFFLLNGGFPVNMTGEADPIAASRIQLTRGLLYAGAVQASGTDKSGIQELDNELQRRVFSDYVALSGEGQ